MFQEGIAFCETGSSNLLRKRSNTKRRSVRQLRAAETPEQSQAWRQAEYLATQRAAETPELSQARRLQQATCMVSHIQKPLIS
ncbi:hypothetical protein TNCV_2319441 [Trichonephila clavipes]|nr:hypothetical protein TNCV_2319441 [Trichonephila clavipes]